jgi:outer membrane protein assembly factor BamB
MMKKWATLMLVAASLSGCAMLGIGGNKDKEKTPVLGERLPVLNYEADADADPALADVPVALPPAVTNDSWSQPGGSADKSMGHLALGTELAPAWSVSIGEGSSARAHLSAGPVIANGRVFTIDTMAVVRAFDAATGKTVWTKSLDPNGKNQRSLFGGGVSVDGDKLYATTGVGEVVAMAAADGRQLWRVTPGGPLRGAPTIANGQVYVTSQDNQLYALKVEDGSPEWDTAATLEIAGVFGSAAPAVAQGTVVAGFSSGELNAYRYENGRAVWGDMLSRTGISTSVSTLSDIDAEPVIDEGKVYAVGQGGRMAALDITTGQRLWELNIAGVATPAVAGEWIFVVTDQAKLLCIARSSGKVRWLAELPRWRNERKEEKPIHWVGPVIAGDRLILASSDGRLANMSPADGKLLSVVDLNTPIFLQPAVANNTLYILDDKGHLTAWR